MEGLQCPIDKEDLGEQAGLHVKCLFHALTCCVVKIVVRLWVPRSSTILGAQKGDHHVDKPLEPFLGKVLL